MRKTIRRAVESGSRSRQEWLDLEAISVVEVSSEDPNFPIESAFAGEGHGWRAAEKGKQVIQIVFDRPTRLQRVRLEFLDAENERTQEFTLRWARSGEALREIVRQQWNFSPQGSTREVEDYRVDLQGVSLLELTITPDVASEDAFACLSAWQLQ